ncbi:MAG TPA: hypothetical protein DF984_07170 [Anaerolineaceae bacterium]|jgi:hypothetical protein|nr:hypothetical protein [Anaerolineaceae bacterium]
MKGRTLIYLSIIFILLGSGLILFRLLNQNISPTAEPGFREWLWEARQLDVIVQVLFVFGGALGIAAILPFEGDDD